LAPGTIWTVGHSTRTLEEFLLLLGVHSIGHVADVRSFPGSRRYPHFGSEALAAALTERGIGYSWHRALGGRRKPSPDSPNTGWRHSAFRAYADHVASGEFEEGLAELLSIAASAKTAFMCSEAVWWRCHRRIIADVLVSRGIAVRHIIDEKPAGLHVLAPPAHLLDGRLSYTPIGPLGI